MTAEAIMNKAASKWLPGTFGALIGIAIVAAFGNGVVEVESGTIREALHAGATLGRTVVEFTALGVALGFVAFGLRLVVAHVVEARRAAPRTGAMAVDAPSIARVVTIPRLADATASEFDDGVQPAFAPVTSLTEAQVERERALRRRGYTGTSGHSARLR
jgi:hypothetical protein